MSKIEKFMVGAAVHWYQKSGSFFDVIIPYLTYNHSAQEAAWTPSIISRFHEAGKAQVIREVYSVSLSWHSRKPFTEQYDASIYSISSRRQLQNYTYTKGRLENVVFYLSDDLSS